MDGLEARERYIQMLMDHVRRDRFPSIDHLKRIEASLTPDMAGEYIELLLEKAADDQFPSPTMLKRIENVVYQLPQRPASRRRELAGFDDEEYEEEPDE